MARKKVDAKARAPGLTSTAAIFRGISSPDELVTETSTKAPEPPVVVEPDTDRPEDSSFPLNYIYEFQDFLNNNLDFCKGAQLLVLLYLTQILYLYLNKTEQIDTLWAVGYNILGVIVASVLSYRSLLRRHHASNGTVKYPQLPEFNQLYAIYIPTILTVLLQDYNTPFFQMNLALNNFSIKSLHPVAKVLSAFVFNYVFIEDAAIDLVKFGLAIWVYFTVEFALTLWNEEEVDSPEKDSIVVRRTMADAEIHLCAVLVANLLVNFNFELSESVIPLFIARELALSLFGAIAFAYPVFIGLRSLEPGFLLKIAGLAVVAIFSGAFYYLMNYQFNAQVYNVEVISWLYDYILLSELRVKLLAGWITALLATIPTVYVLSTNDVLSLNLRRKVWHFLLVGSLAYPALIKEPVFTAIATLGSVFVFIVLEMVRCTQLTFIGDFLNTQLRLFQDEKDTKGPLNLSYIFLLVGTSIPLAYSIVVGDAVSIRSYFGLVTLGLGDSLASIVGKKFGKVKWRSGTRTLEGTLTYIAATFGSYAFIDHYLLPEANKVTQWENLLIVSVLSGVLEGSATLNDNILIPCMTLLAFELLNGVFA